MSVFGGAWPPAHIRRHSRDVRAMFCQTWGAFEA